MQPPTHALTRAQAGGKAAIQQIAAGRRFPIHHFARDKNPGQRLEHEAGFKAPPGHTTGGADGLGDGADSADRNPQGLDRCGEDFRVGKLVFGEHFMQQGNLDALETKAIVQMFGRRSGSTWTTYVSQHPIGVTSWRKIEREAGAAVRIQLLAEAA